MATIRLREMMSASDCYRRACVSQSPRCFLMEAKNIPRLREVLPMWSWAAKNRGGKAQPHDTTATRQRETVDVEEQMVGKFGDVKRRVNRSCQD